MQKRLITEADIQEALSKGKKTLEIPEDSIVTPLALEKSTEEGVQLVRITHTKEDRMPYLPGHEPLNLPKTASEGAKVIVFGSDHGGFQLKEILKVYAESLGYKVMDVGTKSEQPCDYPDFAYAVARAVSIGEAWRGVMIDGAGIGSCVVANKVPGIRAACCHSEFVARNAREHNDTNVLTLGSRVTGTELCKEILRIWLETWFAGGRHKQRVDKVDELERRLMKKI